LVFAARKLTRRSLQRDKKTTRPSQAHSLPQVCKLNPYGRVVLYGNTKSNTRAKYSAASKILRTKKAIFKQVTALDFFNFCNSV
jgi:hypothetical protein